jgi:hypothetical protein
MKKQQEANALREQEKEKERLIQEGKDLVEKKKQAAVAKSNFKNDWSENAKNENTKRKQSVWNSWKGIGWKRK